MYPYNHQGETDSQSHIMPGPHGSQSQFIATLSAQLISMLYQYFSPRSCQPLFVVGTLFGSRCSFDTQQEGAKFFDLSTYSMV